MNDMHINREFLTKPKHTFFCAVESSEYYGDRGQFWAHEEEEAFQQASEKWFGNKEVAWHDEKDGVITLYRQNVDGAIVSFGALKRG